MAKLILRFEQNILKEVSLAQDPLTIGRLPDNVLQIDNLAVSGHHAKIYRDQDHYVVEDLGSLNGTYVNNQRVGKSALKSGDQITIGKHLVQFKDEGQQAPAGKPVEPAGPATPKLDATVVLDTKKAQDMIAASAAAESGSGPLGLSKPAPSATPLKERFGILNVLEGRTDESQYVLTGKMTMIGKSNMATIRLKGLFAPKTAALISKRDNKYFIAASDSKIKLKVNGEDVSGQRELNEGDILEVAGVKAAFTLQE
ncbi:MAG TPA: FHA domain-containing protein [Candidatus Angelobacter sp.]|nr:FHA domain-containing protein [Candidatus Angelobacter sp.]